MRAVSVPTDLETVPDNEDDETDRESPKKDFIRPRTATGRTLSYTKSNGELDEAESVGGSGRRRPASVQIYGSNRSNIGDTTFGQDGGREEALAKLMGRQEGSASPGSTTSRRNSLMKPGVSYRVRPKRISMTSTGRVSVASARSDGTGIFDPPALVTHDRYTSSSTEGELITPLPSMDKIDTTARAEEILIARVSIEDDDCEKDGETDDDRRDVDKRMSILSTTTVTFGQ